MSAPARSGSAEAPTAYLAASLCLLLAYGLVQLRWGEGLELSNGLGFYDGRRYGEIAMNFRAEVFEQGLDAYRLQRVLPSALVHLGLRATGQPLDPPHVRDAFRIYNLGLLLLTALTWVGIARQTNLDSKSAFLGFSLLFLNFANLKMPFYNAVLTDTTALALGALLVYFYLRSSGRGMFSVLALGAFTWPSLSLGSLLYVFPRGPGPARLRLLRPRNPAVGALAALVLGGALAFYEAILAERPWPLLTVAILLAYVFVTLSSLLSRDGLFEWRILRRNLSWARLTAVVGLVFAVQVVVARLSTGAPGFTPQRYLREVVFYTSLHPGLFLVAHAVYFGVVVCLVLACWPEFCRAAHALGIGMTLYIAVLLAQSVDPESRHLISALPAFVLLAVLAARAVDWPSWAIWSAAVVGVIGSKAWWPINQGPFGNYLDPPFQYYHMNHGGAMSPASYRFQGVIVAVVTLGTLWVRRRCLPTPEVASRGWDTGDPSHQAPGSTAPAAGGD
jgi:hypothetical protein